MIDAGALKKYMRPIIKKRLLFLFIDETFGQGKNVSSPQYHRFGQR